MRIPKCDTTDMKDGFKAHPVLTRVYIAVLLITAPAVWAAKHLWDNRGYLADVYKDLVPMMCLPWEDRTEQRAREFESDL